MFIFKLILSIMLKPLPLNFKQSTIVLKGTNTTLPHEFFGST